MSSEVYMNEIDLFNQYPNVLELLLKDRTTQKNIFWATDSYAGKGAGFQFSDPITIEHVIGEDGMMVRPRSMKSPDEQKRRIKEKAEVFTPSWVCNAQNNLVDEAWFGRPNVFNTESIDETGTHTWTPTKGSIAFDNDGKERDWKGYVRDTRLEITCGEAPYLVSRYDTTTGKFIPIERRIGLLDRKLRVVGENCHTMEDWLDMAQDAYKNIYGYEWQGDNLLLARMALLFSFYDYFMAKFGKAPDCSSFERIAYIISWNIWQMDGLKMVVPESCNDVYEENLFGEKVHQECRACKKGDILGHIGIPCVIRDWNKERPKDWKPKDGDDIASKPWQKITFSSLIHREADMEE